jgi:hypothetical protein
MTEEVAYPPPPARVETVPPQKNRLDVWIDGQWAWDGKTWTWLAGAWVTPPRGAYFTPWATTRRADGRLLFARAVWRAKDGRPLDFGLGHDRCPAAPVTPRSGEVAKAP